MHKLSVLFFLFPALFAAATHGHAINETDEYTADIQLSGIVSVVGFERVSITSAEGASGWLAIDDSFEGMRLVKIDAKNNRAKFERPDGQTFYVELREDNITAKPIEPSPAEQRKDQAAVPVRSLSEMMTPGEFAELKALRQRLLDNAPKRDIVVERFPPEGYTPRTDDLDWEFIRSDENPYRFETHSAALLIGTDTTALKQVWHLLTDEDKALIVDNYRHHGLQVTFFHSQTGLSSSAKSIKPIETNE